MLFCGTRLPTPLRHHQHHPLQAAAVAAPVNASKVEFTVNTGNNKSSFSKDWPDKQNLEIAAGLAPCIIFSLPLKLTPFSKLSPHVGLRAGVLFFEYFWSHPSLSGVTHEEIRLEESRMRLAHWQRWGPYLAERAWGTVREDYSPHGNAWEYLPHDHHA